MKFLKRFVALAALTACLAIPVFGGDIPGPPAPPPPPTESQTVKSDSSPTITNTADESTKDETLSNLLLLILQLAIGP
jgi:hypothetical protein